MKRLTNLCNERFSYIAGFIATIFVIANIAVVFPSETEAKENTINSISMMSPKTAICGGIGCDNGNRECGTASATISIGYPGVASLEVDVTYQCYEEPPAD